MWWCVLLFLLLPLIAAAVIEHVLWASNEGIIRETWLLVSPNVTLSLTEAVARDLLEGEPYQQITQVKSGFFVITRSEVTLYTKQRLLAALSADGFPAARKQIRRYETIVLIHDALIESRLRTFQKRFSSRRCRVVLSLPRR